MSAQLAPSTITTGIASAVLALASILHGTGILIWPPDPTIDSLLYTVAGVLILCTMNDHRWRRQRAALAAVEAQVAELAGQIAKNGEARWTDGFAAGRASRAGSVVGLPRQPYVN